MIKCFPKITSRLISRGTWLLRCTTLLIDLTLGEHLQILGERWGGMYKSGICDTKPAISLRRSQSYYRVSIETGVWPID